jgi:thiol-disulfide isomerase/thioredoxin
MAWTRDRLAVEVKRIARAVAMLLCVAVLLTGCTTKAPHPRDALAKLRFSRVSGPMPAIAADGLMGGAVSPSSYAGKVVLVNFWASWCAPCVREQPGLEALWRQLESSGRVAFIGVNYRDQSKPARSYAQRFSVTYPLVSDPEGSLGAAFGVPFLPATIMADPSGRLRYRMVGAQQAPFLKRLILALERPA